MYPPRNFRCEFHDTSTCCCTTTRPMRLSLARRRNYITKDDRERKRVHERASEKGTTYEQTEERTESTEWSNQRLAGRRIPRERESKRNITGRILSCKVRLPTSENFLFNFLGASTTQILAYVSVRGRKERERDVSSLFLKMHEVQQDY